MATKLTQKQLVGLSLISSGATAVSELVLSGAERELSKTNERISKLRAEDARKRGKEVELKKRRRGKKIVGSTRAALAAQGIRVDVGSARDIQEEAKDIIEVDATTIRINALREALGFETDAELASAQGKLVQSRRRLSAVDTLLSGGVRAAEHFFGKGN